MSAFHGTFGICQRDFFPHVDFFTANLSPVLCCTNCNYLKQKDEKYFCVYFEAKLIVAQSSNTTVAAENPQKRGYSRKAGETFTLEETSKLLSKLGNSLPFSPSDFIISFLYICLTLDCRFSTILQCKKEKR